MSYLISANTTHTASLNLRILGRDDINWPRRKTVKDLMRVVEEVAAKYNITGDCVFGMDDPQLVRVDFISERRREFVENAAHQLIEWLLYRRDLAGA